MHVPGGALAPAQAAEVSGAFGSQFDVTAGGIAGRAQVPVRQGREPERRQSAT